MSITNQIAEMRAGLITSRNTVTQNAEETFLKIEARDIARELPNGTTIANESTPNNSAISDGKLLEKSAQNLVE